ncbi:hypothetical protein ACIRLA_36675 [Streptomyces sp. NPDC102364]|uniref:hypothetical protein n=1 Tax=Streptomyces sp. NPDC102364 TaxID=3366161 RepID=UPI003813C860
MTEVLPEPCVLGIQQDLGVEGVSDVRRVGQETPVMTETTVENRPRNSLMCRQPAAHIISAWADQYLDEPAP